METDSIIGIGFLMGILGIGGTFTLFLMKQIADIKKCLSDLSERMAREETKSKIYHEKDK